MKWFGKEHEETQGGTRKHQEKQKIQKGRREKALRLPLFLFFAF